MVRVSFRVKVKVKVKVKVRARVWVRVRAKPPLFFIFGLRIEGLGVRGEG